MVLGDCYEIMCRNSGDWGIIGDETELRTGNQIFIFFFAHKERPTNLSIFGEQKKIKKKKSRKFGQHDKHDNRVILLYYNMKEVEVCILSFSFFSFLVMYFYLL